MAAYNKGKYFGIGVENWFLLISIFSGINVALGSWKNQNFSNFIPPSEFIELFYGFLKNYSSLILILYSISFIQTTLCIFIEKAIYKDYITEGTGQVLYLINGFSLPNCFIAACFFTNKIGPVPSFFAVGILLHLFCLKVLSYMYVNYKQRRGWQNEQNNSTTSDKENANDVNTKDAKDKEALYLQSLNLKNLYLFMYVSPSLVYKPNSDIHWKLDISFFISAFIKGLVIFYIALNILNVFIVDDVKNSIRFINNGELFQVIKIALKITVPIHLVWLLIIYYFNFCVFFESWSKGVGYPLNQDYDWWNSDTAATFWSKWNVIVHEWMKETVYKPLLIVGVSKTTASTMVFALSGLFHSYCFEFPFRLFNGFGFIAMVVQVPLQEFTNYVSKQYGKKLSNAIIWLQIMVGHPVAIITMYYHYVSSQIR